MCFKLSSLQLSISTYRIAEMQIIEFQANSDIVTIYKFSGGPVPLDDNLDVERGI